MLDLVPRVTSLSPAGPPGTGSREPRTGSWRAIVFAATLVRLIVAASTPLFPDETYYWVWSRHLAAGYFDHPPAVAWLIRAGTLIFGDTPLGVRFGTVLAGTIGIVLMCSSARRVAGERGALLAAIVFAVMPLSAAGLVLATPDAPLLAATAATAYALLRVLESPPRSRASITWWCAAGVALGAGFCSKYTSALLPLAVFAALLSRRDLRIRLREPGPYLATAIALLVFLPVVIWNAEHSWVSFAFQLQHGLGDAGGSVIQREAELIGGQLGLVSPILFVMMALAVARSFRHSASAFLGVIAIAIFVFFMYSATHRRVEANWPALAYLPGVLLLVAHVGGRRWDAWLRSGIVVAVSITIVVYVNAFTPILPVRAGRDPAARAAGWSDLARAVDHARRNCSSASSMSDVPAPTSPVLPPMSDVRCPMSDVASDRYQEASELAFHLPDHPETFSLNLSGRPNQYDLWPAFPERGRVGESLLVVVDDVAGTHPTIAILAPHFAKVSRGDQVALTRAGELVKNLRIWRLDGWRGTWPPGRLRSRT